jgi:Domain of unknown function (DUF4412)
VLWAPDFFNQNLFSDKKQFVQMKQAIIFGMALFITVWAVAGPGVVITQKYAASDVPAGAVVTVTWYVTQTQCKMKMEYKDDKTNTVNWFLPQFGIGKLQIYTEGDVPAGAQKAYYEVSPQDIKPTGATNVARISVQKTGEIKNIGGFNCEKMIVKTNKGTTEMWVTTDFKPDYFKFYPFFQTSTALMGLNEESIQGFPIEYIIKDNLGNITGSNTFISASKADINDTEFKLPAEYKNAAELAAPAGK